MVRTLDERVRSPRLARSFTPGYRPPPSGPDALAEGEALFVIPDALLLFGIGGGAFAEFSLGGGLIPVPLPGDRYVHIQAAASASWIVNHNLGRLPVIAVLSASGAQVLAAVEHASNNQARVELDGPMTGRAICV